MQFTRCGIQNFLSYYGATNIEFGPTTIVLGQNNTGKSKLFDAINWVLFSRAYHTESETWKLTHQWKLGGLDLINRRALREVQDGKPVNAKVTLRVEGDEGEEYEFQRTLQTKISSAGGWEHCSESIIVYINKVTGDTEVYQGDEALRVIVELVPPNLQPYFLFQGESVSQLLKLSDTKAYGKAIREMARIDVLENAEQACKIVRDRMNRRLNSAKSQDEKEQKEKERIGAEIEQLEKNTEKAIARKAEQDETYKDLSQHIEEIHQELSRSEEYKKKLDHLRAQESVLVEKRKRYDTHQQQAARRIADWLSIPSEGLLSGFTSMFTRLSKANVVPQPVQDFFLQDILKNKHCQVCNRPLDIQSEQHVLSILQSIEGRKTVDHVMQLAALIDTDLKGIKSSKTEIEDWKAHEAALWDEITRLNKTIGKLRNELDEVRPSSESDDELKTRFERRKREVRELEDKKRDTEYSIRLIDKDVQQWAERLKELRAQMRQLTIGGDNDKEVWTADVAERLYATASELREKYRVRIARGIEGKANQYFQEMTSENHAAVGDLKMDLTTGGVYMVDVDGQPIENVNQATRVSMQLSFVAGLLYEAGEALGVTFPFIADAPVSSLGGDNKLAAIRSMAQAFEQAVIILKDDVTSRDDVAISADPVRALIATKDVDKAYLLTMSDGDPNTQYSVISTLKE